MLLGRRTWQLVAASGRDATTQSAAWMNAVPKPVASRTLTDAVGVDELASYRRRHR